MGMYGPLFGASGKPTGLCAWADEAGAVQRKDGYCYYRGHPGEKRPPRQITSTRASLLRVNLDRVWVQIRPIAPRRMGSSKYRQERAATTIVATTWSASREKLALCCGPGAMSTMIG
jgi:hypothetical protein